jgi:hypothetical protein
VAGFPREVVRSIVRDEADSGTERIANGAFASGASWTITGAKWTIGSGLATEAGTGNGLNQTLSQTITAGQPYAFSVSVGGSIQGLDIIFTSGGTPTETIYSGIPIAATISVSGWAAANFDGIRFQTTSFGSTTLDNVSLIV